MARTGGLPLSANWRTGTSRAFCAAGEYLFHFSCQVFMFAVGTLLEGPFRGYCPGYRLHSSTLPTASITRAKYVVLVAADTSTDYYPPVQRCTRNFRFSTLMPRELIVCKLVSAGRTVCCSGPRPLMDIYLLHLSAPNLFLPDHWLLKQ